MATEPQPQKKADKPTYLCPACKRRQLVDHCDSPHCTWHRCRNAECDLTADVAKGIGHCLPLIPGPPPQNRPTRTRWTKAAA